MTGTSTDVWEVMSTARTIRRFDDRAGEFTSILFAQKRLRMASDMLLGGSIFPAMQNFLLAARAQGLGACLTSWASYGGEELLRLFFCEAKVGEEVVELRGGGGGEAGLEFGQGWGRRGWSSILCVTLGGGGRDVRGTVACGEVLGGHGFSLR